MPADVQQYTILGSDRKEYGPATLAQMRLWVNEGRIDRETWVKVEGGGWKPLWDYPELAALLAARLLPAMTPERSCDSGAERDRVQQMVGSAATGLLVTAALGFLGSGVGIILNAFGVGLGAMGRGAEEQLERVGNMFGGAAGMIGGVFGLLISGVILFGAIKMRNLEGYPLAFAAAILAIVPCFSPCCLVGLPFGIWALTVLVKPEVKAQFR